MRSIGQQILTIYKGQPYGYKAMIGMWDRTATERLEEITKEAEKEGVTEEEMKTFILAFQRSTTQNITTLLIIRLKLQENNERTANNWYGSQSSESVGSTSTQSQESKRSIASQGSKKTTDT